MLQQLLALQFCNVFANIPQRVSPLSAAILCLFTLDLRLLQSIQERAMLTQEARQELEKQGYRVIGEHSAVS